MNLSKDLKENIKNINLPVKDSFDIISRELIIGNRAAYLMFIDGFAKDDLMYYVIQSLQRIDSKITDNSFIDTLIKQNIAYLETDIVDNIESARKSVLCGSIVFLIENEDRGIIVDAREYPARGPQEAETEKVTRGSKDGFVETIVFNTALIRRRVRDENLIFEMKSVGKKSQTDVSIGYLKNIVDEKLLNEIRERISKINIDSLVMAEKSLEECLLKKYFYNPLPLIKYTQRPDIAASYLFEGHIIILVDTSPSVMVVPVTLFYFTQFAEDFYQNPLVGTYYRFVRALTIIISLILTPLWLVLAENADILAEFLKIIGAKENISMPVILQFLILEFGFDLLKTSSLHTPDYLGGAFGIVGGLLLGDFAIRVGFFVPETIFYTALTAIANFCIPNVEFASAIRIFRLFILLSTGLFDFYGFCISLLCVIIITATTKTFKNAHSYLWPLIPFNKDAFIKVFIRKPV